MSVHGFTVYDMIARGALVHGDAPAIIQGERQLSFREFQRQVDVLAGGLAALGIGKGDRICVLAQNDTAYLTLYGACARQGVIAYPINWRLTAQEVERVVERAAPRMMVVDASTLPVMAGWPERKKSVAHWYQFGEPVGPGFMPFATLSDRKSTRLNSSHSQISYAVFCLKKKTYRAYPCVPAFAFDDPIGESTSSACG